MAEHEPAQLAKKAKGVLLAVSRMVLMPFPGLKIKSHTLLEGEKGFYLGIYFKDP